MNSASSSAFKVLCTLRKLRSKPSNLGTDTGLVKTVVIPFASEFALK